MINIPIKPNIIANKFLNLIFSPSNGIANIVAIIGAVWSNAWFSANNKNLRPKKKNTIHNTAEKALIKWINIFLLCKYYTPKM